MASAAHARAVVHRLPGKGKSKTVSEGESALFQDLPQIRRLKADISRQVEKLSHIASHRAERTKDIQTRLRNCLYERLTQITLLTALEVGFIGTQASSEDATSAKEYEQRIYKNTGLITIYKNMPDEDQKQEKRITVYLAQKQKEFALIQT